MTDEFPSRLLEKVVVRLPDGMRDRLKAEAEANKRSMNAEIVARLEQSFNASSDTTGLDALGNIVDKIDPSVMTKEEWQEKFNSFSESFRKIAVNMEAVVRKVRSHYDEEDKG